MSDQWLPFDVPSDEQILALRRHALRELERISEEELARRLKVPLSALGGFLQGDRPEAPLLIALSVYDFGPYPDLTQLMSARFHQSYDYDTGSFESWEPAVDDFVEGETSGRIAGVVVDIGKLLAASAEDRTVRRILESLGCRFVFDSISLTPRQWLEAVRDRLLQRRA